MGIQHYNLLQQYLLPQDEKPPHAFFMIGRNLNKGMVSSGDLFASLAHFTFR